MTSLNAVRPYARTLEKISLLTMILGLVFACQPFSQWLFTWSMLVMLIALVAYNIFARIEDEPADVENASTVDRLR
jgi:protein-S-isoprenylcysteine O-methyltransferase Ste14